MPRLLCLLVACLLTAVLAAADTVREFKRAMAGNDAQEKRDAIQALARSSADDDTVLPLLIQAAGDRQGKRWAIPALRQRTGLQPGRSRGDNTGYPGYPSDDTQSGWSRWLTSRNQALAEEAKVEEALEKAEEARETAEDAKNLVTAVDLDGDGRINEAEEAAAQEAAGDGEAGGDETGENEAASPEASEFGKLDRLFFTDGSILRCYVMTRRTDLDGKLTSVRIVHKGGGGEEIIDAEVIARIEEDIE